MERRIIQPQEQQKPKFEPVGDEDFKVNAETEIEKIGDKKGNELVAFVEREIFKMNNKLLFNGERAPSIYELDYALATYQSTLFALIALYEQAKYDAEIAKAKYEEFYNTKYMEVRNKYNNIDVKNSQWLSAKEVEATTYSVYKKELAELKADWIAKDCERSTTERLCRGWESYQFVLGQLSRNSIAEINSSGNPDLYRGDEVDDGVGNR